MFGYETRQHHIPSFALHHMACGHNKATVGSSRNKGNEAAALNNVTKTDTQSLNILLTVSLTILPYKTTSLIHPKNKASNLMCYCTTDVKVYSDLIRHNVINTWLYRFIKNLEISIKEQAGYYDMTCYILTGYG